jgi:hypothetical protein
MNGSASDIVVSVTVYRTFKDGTSIDRDAVLVYEDGTWKHRFGEEEIGFFMPEASYEEFVAAQQGSSPEAGFSTSEAAVSALPKEEADEERAGSLHTLPL